MCFRRYGYYLLDSDVTVKDWEKVGGWRAYRVRSVKTVQLQWQRGILSAGLKSGTVRLRKNIFKHSR